MDLLALLVTLLTGPLTAPQPAPPTAPQPAPPAEMLAAIQVRGNVATSDHDVSAIAGLEIGMPVGADTVPRALERLRASKRFDSVDVLKRYASLSDPTQVVIVVIVDEGPVSIQRTNDPNNPTRVVRRKWPRLLVLPIFGIRSGYGATYGVRLTHPDAAGRDSRLSFPGTWGGQKEIGAELEKRFPGGWLTRIEVGGGLARSTNPHYDADEDRKSAWFRAERQITPTLRVRALTGWRSVSLQDTVNRVTSIGAEVVLDTRLDPFLARNAIYFRATESRLGFDDRDAVGRTDLEAHGYLGVVGQSILVASARMENARGSLPDSLKPLLGGPTSVRGFKTGTAAGDSLATGSLELRVPLTSPLSFGKVGVSAFIDAGTVYDQGQRFADQPLRQGVGGSVWFAAAFVRINVAVAHGIGASTRVHVSGNLTF